MTPNADEPEVIFFQPIDEGFVKITDSWGFDVSSRMLRRFDRGSLVIWRKGFTIWLNSYSAEDVSIEIRKKKIVDTMSPGNLDFEQVSNNGLHKIRYRLEEDMGDQREASSYLFGLTENEEVHIAVYYDDPSDKVDVEKIWNSLQCGAN